MEGISVVTVCCLLDSEVVRHLAVQELQPVLAPETIQVQWNVHRMTLATSILIAREESRQAPRVRPQQGRPINIPQMAIPPIIVILKLPVIPTAIQHSIRNLYLICATSRIIGSIRLSSGARVCHYLRISRSMIKSVC